MSCSSLSMCASGEEVIEASGAQNKMIEGTTPLLFAHKLIPITKHSSSKLRYKFILNYVTPNPDRPLNIHCDSLV